MAEKSSIEWTDATWNIITGCTLVDEGCRHCYAAHLITSWPAIGNHPSRKGLARKNAAGESKFTGEVRFNEQWLDQPLRWRKPRKIFVCAHGDLFHESVPDEWLDKIFAVMALAPQHTFQVLTKRPGQARAYLSANPGIRIRSVMQQIKPQAIIRMDWPLPNIWLGTSISDQASADLRIPQLLDCPASVRFVSAEPLLGPVDLRHIVPNFIEAHFCTIACTARGDQECCKHLPGIDWVIVGGESGPHARPMHPDWARQIRDQCEAAGVPFLFKQWGEWAPSTEEEARGNPRSGWRTLVGHPHVPRASELYPENGAAFIEHKGKKRTGRLLDGVTHNDFPKVAS